MNKSSNQKTGTYFTWVKAEPIIRKEDVEKITKTASPLTKARLLFKRSQYSIDGDSVIRYKTMNGITYVMKRGTRL